MASDHHGKPYDEGTLIKLNLFDRYIREWLPVFINRPDIRNIQIFDLFCGPGSDSLGTPGTPLRIINVINEFKEDILKKNTNITAYFNDKATGKVQELKSKLAQECPDCLEIKPSTEDFSTAFSRLKPLMERANTASLLLLDPTGLPMDPELFKQIINLRLTDFLLFNPSEFIHRFKSRPGFANKWPGLEDFETGGPKETTKAFCNYLEENFIPAQMEYHLAHFDFRKQKGNIYGVIFGSANWRGLEKFLEPCWKLAPHNGEASFALPGDFEIPDDHPVLPGLDKSGKLKQFEKSFRDQVLNGRIKDTKGAYYAALRAACLPRHAKKVLSDLCREGALEATKTPPLSYESIFKKKKVIPLVLRK